MNEEYFHLPITTISPPAAKAIHDFAQEVLSHGAGARVIFDAVAHDPECALGHAYAAAVYLTLMTREGQAQAAPHIAAAIDNIAFCSARETATVEAIAAWGIGDERSAISILRGVVECAPHDVVAAKLCQILELIDGDIIGMLRTSGMAASVEGRSGYALGLHAFALEQAGHAELALRFARRAIDMNPDRDPWAQHALAHALLAMDQPVEARAFLHSVSYSWDRCSSFMLTHNWWHLALIELELGNKAEALALFDERVWAQRKGHAQDQINAISLLFRLEMQGVRPAARWEDIASHIDGRTTDQLNGFLDLHYLIALVQSGRTEAAVRLSETLQRDRFAGAVASGIVAYAQQDYREAAAALAPACHHLAEIGGSNVQRELFELIFADSVQRSRFQPARAAREYYRVAA
jgi:tetratricopeptide (TPR) repeat protein